MTPQMIFNTVVNHLYVQGCPSYGEYDDVHTGCLYRAPNGDMCAIGCLIPDEVYTPEMENNGCDVILKKLPDYLSKHGELLNELQRVHDNSFNWADSQPAKGWDYPSLRNSLLSVANMFNLKLTSNAKG